MAAPNSQFPSGSGSSKPIIVPKKEPKEEQQEEQEQDSFSIERERLAKEVQAIKEEYVREEAIRFKRYEAEMREELMGKYFSDKDIFGDKVFEETGADSIKAAKNAIVESYADPVAYLKKKEASAAANTSTGQATNGFPDIVKKNMS